VRLAYAEETLVKAHRSGFDYRRDAFRTIQSSQCFGYRFKFVFFGARAIVPGALERSEGLDQGVDSVGRTDVSQRTGSSLAHFGLAVIEQSNQVGNGVRASKRAERRCGFGTRGSAPVSGGTD
jgi:hypothetical protein